MIVNLRLRKNIKHLSLIERFQILPLADRAVTARSIIPDRLIVLLLHTTLTFTVEHVDDLLRQGRRRGKYNPPREGINPKHRKNHTITTRQQPAAKQYLRGSLKRMSPHLLLTLLKQ